MATIPCTKQEYSQFYFQFTSAIKDNNNTDEGITNAYKCLVLAYLGCKDDLTELEKQNMAMSLELAMQQAIDNGWHVG